MVGYLKHFIGGNVKKTLISLCLAFGLSACAAAPYVAGSAKVATQVSPDFHAKVLADVRAANKITPEDDKVAKQCYNYLEDWLVKHQPIVFPDVEGGGIIYKGQKLRNTKRLYEQNSKISEEGVVACGPLALDYRNGIADLLTKLGLGAVALGSPVPIVLGPAVPIPQ